jgi:prepilin-type processing-associated H-X9-DG protein
MTLRDVIIVIVVVAVAVLLGLPAIQQSREAARRTECRNHLKMIGLALDNYHSWHERYPMRTCCEPSSLHSWRGFLVPYIDLPRELVNRDVAWDAPENLASAQIQYRQYHCPSSAPSTDGQGRWLTAYVGVVGPNTFFPDHESMRKQDITDSLAQTIAVVEGTGLQIVWIEPRDADMAVQRIAIEGGLRSSAKSTAVISSPHTGGAHVLMADGSVRFVAEKISPTLLSALLTATGGETVPGDFDAAK